MLKAGALSYATLISLLLIALCAMLIEGQFLSAKLFEKEELTLKLHDNIESGINIFLCKPELFEYEKERSVYLFDDTAEKVIVKKKLWGAFELVKIKAQCGLIKIEKNALLGSARDKDSLTALFMSRQNNYLYVAGNTSIKGNCFVPGGIIKLGQIEGKKFSGVNPVDGILHESTSDLPEVNSMMVSQVENYMTNTTTSDSTTSFEKIKGQKELYNSFENRTLLISSEAPILLAHTKMEGNIILRSSKRIEVDSSARLNGIIIYAPEIHIKEYFKGTIQAFGRDSILVDKNCKLSYPSLLGVITKGEASIKIEEGSTIKGMIFLFQKENVSNKKSLLTFCKGAELIGSVFCNSNIDLRGKISGNVFCSSFVVKIRTSFNENYLLDAEINSTNLPKFYVGPIIYKTSKEELIEWLN
jgi:cytoskeletal protein CcmA (bactofilin family)